MDDIRLVSLDSGIQARYLTLRNQGQSHSMAEMLAFQQAPGLKGTDRAYTQGRAGLADLDQMAAPTRKRFMAMYKRKTGRDMPTGVIYDRNLATTFCDPAAFVSGIDDVKRVAQLRGLKLSGAVNCDYSDDKPRKRVKLAEDLVQSAMRRQIGLDPEKAKMDKRELRELVIDLHSPKYADSGVATKDVNQPR